MACRVLKNGFRPHLCQSWVIPPEENGEFVARMEDLIDLYQRPSNPKVPVICMDEQPLQLIKEVRLPLSMAPNRPVRYDYEYQRNGTANAFLFTEPLNGWRRVSIRERKTRRDWATEIRTLLVEDYPEAERVIRSATTSTSIPRGRSTKPSPEEAAALRKRLEIHPTPNTEAGSILPRLNSVHSRDNA